MHEVRITHRFNPFRATVFRLPSVRLTLLTNGEESFIELRCPETDFRQYFEPDRRITIEPARVWPPDMNGI